MTKQDKFNAACEVLFYIVFAVCVAVITSIVLHLK